MLKHLTIQNYALIESLDIEFPDGLTIMTGETGAGKSVLLGAVSLLSGGRADKAILRDESRSCVVEGVFETEQGQKILRRVISSGMRSRFFIDDCPVGISEMEDIASGLLDIHGQRGNLLLGDKRWQLDLIDGYCGNSTLVEKYRVEYEAVKNLEKELSEVEKRIAEDKKNSEGRLADLKKLQDASLKEGEVQDLENELALLENAEMLKENSCLAANLLDGEGGSVIHNLREAEKCVEKCAGFDSRLEELIKRMESCRIECKDISSDIEAFGEKTSASPARRSQIEERLGALYSIMKKFGCKDELSLIALRDELASASEQTDSLIDRKNEITTLLSSRRKKREEISLKLSEKRRKGAQKMQKALLEMIRDLEMPASRLVIDVESSDEFTPTGQDSVQILFSANPKEKMVELEKVASGGEQSRIMLCIKSLMASFRKMPTMFFDEIDAGVSGSVADKMGSRIVNMGKDMQVISITHLPQVASKGKAHLLVYKQTDSGGRAAIRIKYIEGRERVLEVARLLSGEKTTPQAIANAEVLLETNK